MTTRGRPRQRFSRLWPSPSSHYASQACRRPNVRGRCSARPWRLIRRSRSGLAHSPWLEPETYDRFEQLHVGGATVVVMVPIGLVPDHTEVLYYLETASTPRSRGASGRLLRWSAGRPRPSRRPVPP
ncbi:ferrochelatase [Streptomyces sp. NPDC127119]|uniref:ferrochelatase n=1 Tax=Streptomyces sp. NPDC127119 TaxID=3345370 RepID=UPI003635D6B2